ncbi:MAG: DnaJ domain-containing protein [Chloroflexi bacterium]|nr:DnaJ domain-containing protein [Chloroflexota bacterium]
MSAQRTYYDLLELEPDATPEQIKRAYRRMVKQVHPDISAKENTTAEFLELQRAYETLGDPQKREAYNARLGVRRPPRVSQAVFRLQLRSSHTQLPSLDEPQMLYAVADIRASLYLRTKRTKRPQLNLCLVLDRSLSMDGQRLRQAKEAALFLVDKLDKDDILSVVVFSDRARNIVQGQAATDRSGAKAALASVRPWGGTELLQGLGAGMAEIYKWRTPDTLDHLILLTDGHTYGDEAGCLEVADAASRDKIGLTLLGLGADWNDQLLDEMAARSGGYSAFVDSPDKLVDVFQERFSQLANVVARNLQLTLHTDANGQIKDVFRLSPDISRLSLQNDRLMLGALEVDQSIQVLIEMLVEPRRPGAARILQGQLSGELLQPDNNSLSEVDSELIVTFDPALTEAAPAPADLMDLVGRVAVFKIQDKAIKEAESGDHRRAQTRLQNLTTHLLNLGEVELARVALLEAAELERTGHLTTEGRKRIRYGTRNLSAAGRAAAPVGAKPASSTRSAKLEEE